jgi:hypothetical protein
MYKLGSGYKPFGVSALRKRGKVVGFLMLLARKWGKGS